MSERSVQSRARVGAQSRLLRLVLVTVVLVAVPSAVTKPAVSAEGTTPYSSAVLADSPRGYWRLDEAADEETAHDSSDNGHDGAYVNVTPGPDNDGAVRAEINSSAHFGATMDLPYQDEIPLGTPPGLLFRDMTFTIEAWVRTSVADGAIAGDDDGYFETPQSWVIFVRSDGRLGARYFDGVKFVRHATGPSIALDDEQWHHVVAVFSPGATSLYVDRVLSGVPEQTTIYVPREFPPGDPQDTLGVTVGDSTGFANFKGDIDEVAMYPSSLSRARIRTHYTTALGSPLLMKYELEASGANGWWRLGDNPGAATATDSSGMDFQGQYRSVTTGVPGALTGDADTAARFLGASSTNDVLVGDIEDLDFDEGDFSVAAWVKTTSNGERAVITKRGSSGPGWAVTVTDDPGYVGRLRAVIDDGTTTAVFYGPQRRVDDGAWHFVAVSVSRTDGVRIYVDGAESETSQLLSGSVANAAMFRIGGGDGYSSFSGDIDEAAAYAFALPADFVVEQYESAMGPASDDSSMEENIDPDEGDTWTDEEETYPPESVPDDPEYEGGTDADDVGEPPTESPDFSASSSAVQSDPEPLPTYCTNAPQQRVCVSSSSTASFVTFRNDQARWTIYRQCIGPSRRPDSDKWKTVGPGYIARVQRRADGLYIVDDVRGPEFYLGNTDPDYGGIHGPPYTSAEWGPLNAVNAYIKGGLGTFNWHHARASQRSSNGFLVAEQDTWNMDGRVCAVDNQRSIGGAMRRFGVVSWSATPPKVSRVGTVPVGKFRVDVFFTDGWVDRLVRVRYHYLVYPRVVKSWIVVTLCYDRCHLAQPGPHRWAFLKEPKLTGSVRREGTTTDRKVDFTRIAAFDRGSTRRIPRNKTRTKAFCAWAADGGIVTFINRTGHCDTDRRVRVRFDFGPPASSLPGDGRDTSNGLCDRPARRCLNVVMLSYPVLRAGTQSADVPIGDMAAPGLRARDWEVYGLDKLARISKLRPRFHAVDNPDPFTCGYSASAARRSWSGIRRWELVGGNKNADDARNPYHAATAYFNGWEGGNGYNDCEYLSSLFPPAKSAVKRESYAMHAQYSINGGWNIPQCGRRTYC